MMSISSQAGRRLAKAKAKLDELNGVPIHEQGDDGRAFSAALNQYARASAEVADELIAQGFHDMDGED